MIRPLAPILCCGLLLSCSNLDDAPLTARETFVRFYASELNYEARVALAEADGFVILGNTMRANENQQDMLLIKTDLAGTRIWEKRIENARANDLLLLADGYILTGESIELNPTEPEVVEQINNNIQLVKIDRNGTETARYTAPTELFIRNQGQANADTLTVDTKGFASTIDDGGNVVTLGSHTTPNGLERTIKLTFNSTLTPQRNGLFYDLLAFNYQNSKSLFNNGSNFLWASTAFPQSQNEFAFSAITNVPANTGVQAVFTTIGENETDRQHLTGDMQRLAVGFGVVGTYSERGTTDDPVGANANIFLARLNPSGGLAGPTIYLDGEELFNGTSNLANPKASGSQDTGDAICSTRDGGAVIAGTYLTNPNRGNGQKDILLTKIDAFGNVQWTRLFGGAGTELVGSVRETPGGYLLLSATVVSPTGDVKSIMLARFDSNGELKN